jgi:hypothetical protein
LPGVRPVGVRRTAGEAHEINLAIIRIAGGVRDRPPDGDAGISGEPGWRRFS